MLTGKSPQLGRAFVYFSHPQVSSSSSSSSFSSSSSSFHSACISVTRLLAAGIIGEKLEAGVVFVN